MNKNRIESNLFFWSKFSRDIFSTKYPNIYSLIDKNWIIYISSMHFWLWEYELWRFENWFFKFNNFFSETDLPTLEEEYKYFTEVFIEKQFYSRIMSIIQDNMLLSVRDIIYNFFLNYK